MRTGSQSRAGTVSSGVIACRWSGVSSPTVTEGSGKREYFYVDVLRALDLRCRVAVIIRILGRVSIRALPVRLTDGGNRMKYMLLIYLDEHALSEEERQKCYTESTQLAHDLSVSGKYLSANPLHPTATATTIRIREGRRLVTDGPFAETREQLGGYFLVDAKDLDEALAIAERIPMASKGTVEVRPIIELPNLPIA